MKNLYNDGRPRCPHCGKTDELTIIDQDKWEHTRKYVCKCEREFKVSFSDDTDVFLFEK